MSQIYSRINIRVSSPKIWERFIDEDDACFDLAELANTNETSFVIDSEWSANYRELYGTVDALADILGEDGIIIADLTDINVDPFDYCIYYLGEEVKNKEFSIYDGKSKCNMHFDTEISDIPGWLKYGGFRISKKEKAVLFKCGISYADGVYSEFSTQLTIPSRDVYIRETGFEERPENIEKLFIGEEVYFVHAADEYDPMRLEVMSELGSVGYLPSDVSDKLTPVLLQNMLDYTAKIGELVPLSRRNAHAKSPIVAIKINAEISAKELPPKTTVPKVDREAMLEKDKKALEDKKAKESENEQKRIGEEDIACKLDEEQNLREAEIAKWAEAERKRIEEEIAMKALEQERLAAVEEQKRKDEEERKRIEEERIKLQEAVKQSLIEAEERNRKEKEEKKRLAEEEQKRKELEAQKLAEEKARKEREAKEKEENKKREYLGNLKQAKKECEEAKGEFSTALDKAIKERTKKLEKERASKLEKLRQNKLGAENRLASLGFFKFGEKRDTRNEIERLENEIQIVGSPSYLNEDIENMKNKAQKAKAKYASELEEYLEKRFPYDPDRKVDTKKVINNKYKSASNEAYMMQILDSMSSGLKYSCADIRDVAGDPISDYEKISASKLSLLLTLLVNTHQCLWRDMSGGIPRFEINDNGEAVLNNSRWLNKEVAEPIKVKPEYNENNKITFPIVPFVADVLK